MTSAASERCACAHLRFLQGKGTSLGGLRPKCTVLDTDGALALGKFPSISDTRSVVRGEVLALKLAGRAKLDVAQARVEAVDGTPVAIIRRFDRTAEGARVAYLSGGSLLQARRDEDRAYTELADALRRVSARPSQDVRELWRRLLFNFLINNVDDHLWNVGVLYAGNAARARGWARDDSLRDDSGGDVARVVIGRGAHDAESRQADRTNSHFVIHEM